MADARRRRPRHAARAGETAGAARAALAGNVYGSADDIAVLDGDRLAGLVSIEQLLAAPDDTPHAAIMDPTRRSSAPRPTRSAPRGR